MSTRHLERLRAQHGTPNPATLSDDAEEASDAESEVQAKAFNPFDLLSDEEVRRVYANGRR